MSGYHFSSWRCRSCDRNGNITADFKYTCASMSVSIRNKLPTAFFKIKDSKGIFKTDFQVGIPAGIQSTVINFSNVLLQSSVNSFGSIAMAGYTAANNIFGFLYVTVNAVTQACMSFYQSELWCWKMETNGSCLDRLSDLIICCNDDLGKQRLFLWS